MSSARPCLRASHPLPPPRVKSAPPTVAHHTSPRRPPPSPARRGRSGDCHPGRCSRHGCSRPLSPRSPTLAPGRSGRRQRRPGPRRAAPPEPASGRSVGSTSCGPGRSPDLRTGRPDPEVASADRRLGRPRKRTGADGSADGTDRLGCGTRLQPRADTSQGWTARVPLQGRRTAYPPRGHSGPRRRGPGLLCRGA